MLELFDTYPILLGVAIFLARVVDVSLGTLRTIIVFRGQRLLAAGIGFVEALIFIVAVSKVIQTSGPWYLVAGYAGGFAMGNYVGIWLEGKLAIGKELVRFVSYQRDVALATAIREIGYRVIELDGRRRGGEPVQVLLIISPRRQVPGLIGFVQGLDPDVLFTTTDVKQSLDEDALLRPAPTARSGWRMRGKRK